MYVPKQFKESRIEILHDFIRQYPLCTIITNSSDGVNANHIPLYLNEAPDPFGELTGHIDKANPMVDDILKHNEVLAVFHGPNRYITPSWIPTKTMD